MFLITELQEDVKYETITEETSGKKNMYISGVFMQCVPNRNKRIYPEEVLHKEVTRYLNESVRANKAYGELGHPSGPTINLERSCHMIKDLRIEGKNIYGRALILETPMGNIVRSLIDAGANLGVSSRGLGSLKAQKDGLMEVQSDFKLVTAADVVADPSAPDAFVQGIMEGVEFYYDESKNSYVEKTVNEMKKMSMREINERKLEIFNTFINEMAKK